MRSSARFAQVRRAASTSGGRAVGLTAISVAVLCFSISSTLIKKAAIPGPTMAFWRMIGASVLWLLILWRTERRTTSLQELRRALVPGIAFGLNITLFFSGITHTTIANAEFIGALTPVVLIPLGVILFHERADRGTIALGAVAIAGLALVLFSAPSRGEARWSGNAMAFSAMCLWCVYLVTSRRLRVGMSVVGIMASVMPIASLTILPIVVIRGELDAVTGRSVPYIVVLVLLTGTAAHGLIVFAQRKVPVSTIGILQVAQPALAVGWSVVLLDASLHAVQLVGMALVIVGLVLVTLRRQRVARSIIASQPNGELAGTAG